MTALTKLLTVDQLLAGYEEKPVLKNLSLELNLGEFIAVCGPNGSGKSTLIKAIQYLLPWQRGEVRVKGQPVNTLKASQMARLMAYVPQVSEPVFNFTVEETVSMARYHRHKNRFSFLTEDDRKAIEEAMELTATAELKDKKLSELSGGERQRVLLARALAQDTPILLLDEPSSHLDLCFQLKIYNLLKELQTKKRIAILVAEHNLNLVVPYCSTLIFLKEGKIEASGPPAELLTEDLIKRIFGLEVELRENRSSGLPEISLIHRGMSRKAEQV